MRRTVIGGAVVALGISTVFASGALAGGNGAARSGLSPTSGSATSGQCVEGSGASGNGFAMLNAPGQPGAAIKLLGEVHLINAAPSSVYTVNVSVAGSNQCMPEGVINTNGQGIGNAHLADSSLGNGSFYVVIQDSAGNEVYATGLLTVN